MDVVDVAGEVDAALHVMTCDELSQLRLTVVDVEASGSDQEQAGPRMLAP